MTQNKRICLNIIATYGRSLYALVIGLFTGRWVLMALGHEDYGLYGVVGGLTVFLSFFNGLLASALSRFYAFEIGRSTKRDQNENEDDECTKWFNTALFIHTIVPLFCTLVGYQFGVWTIRNFLEIPIARVDDCVWVFRFVCISCFCSMVNVPFSAMYTAKQYIAELTVYGIVASSLQAIFLYYIAMHPSAWLVKYSAWTCFLSVVPQVIICMRALVVFKECKIIPRYFISASRIKQLFNYAGWHAFGAMGSILRGQGIAILANKFFGAKINASISIANTVNGQSTSLVSAMVGAFTPAIVQACGAGDEDLMRRMAFKACKFGMVLALIFIIPLSCEIDNVIRLWLKNPPPYVSGLCLCMLVQILFDKGTIGHMIAVNAKGNVALYQFFLGSMLILTLPVAWFFVGMGFGVYSIGIVLMTMMILSSFGRVWFAQRLVGMSMSFWIMRILIPVAAVTLTTVSMSIIPRFTMPASFLRIIYTTIISEIVFGVLSWMVVLNSDERRFVVEKIRMWRCK